MGKIKEERVGGRTNKKKRKIGERGSRHWLFRPTAHIGDYVY